MELNKAHTNNNNNNITNSLSRKREQTNEDCKGRTNSSSNPPSNPNRFKRSVTVFFSPPPLPHSLLLLHLSKAPKIPTQKENRNAKEKITQNVTFELNLNEFCAWLCRRHAHTMVQGGGQTRRSTEQAEGAEKPNETKNLQLAVPLGRPAIKAPRLWRNGKRKLDRAYLKFLVRFQFRFVCVVTVAVLKHSGQQKW